MSLRVLDARRLARVSMIGITGHWTAGGHRANATDTRAYHLLTEGDGTVVYGVDIALNSGTLKSGYAAHTRGANTNRIGLSMCGMTGATESPWNPGPAPLTARQWGVHVLAAADLCEVYRIGVARDRVLFHAEVQGALGIAQAGKWDVARLPFDESVRGARAIGDRFRDEVLSALRGNATTPNPDPLPANAIGATGRVVSNGNLNFRRGPGTGHEVTGALPPGTIVTVIGGSDSWFNVRTPAGHVGWVHGAYVQMLDTARAPEPTVPDPAHARIAAIRTRLDQIEDYMPADRERLMRALDAVSAQLANV